MDERTNTTLTTNLEEEKPIPPYTKSIEQIIYEAEMIEGMKFVGMSPSGALLFEK